MPYEHATLLALARQGAKGVDLFFAISGFLICSRLLEEHQATGLISLKGFYIRRFLRILPAYWLLLAGLSVLALIGLVEVSRRDWLASIFFVRNYVGQGWYTGHLWSLAVEEHFYLLWPGLLAWWSPARARWRVLLLTAVIVVWREADTRLQLVSRVLPDAHSYSRTDLRLDALLLGCWIALLLSDPTWRARLTQWLRGAAWIGILVLLALNVAVHPPLRALWEALLLPVLLAATVLHPYTSLGRLLELRALRWIGRISYSLYLWQQVFLPPSDMPATLDGAQHLPWSVLAACTCAAGSYYLVERPMIRLGHRLAPPTTEGRRENAPRTA